MKEERESAMSLSEQRLLVRAERAEASLARWQELVHKAAQIRPADPAAAGPITDRSVAGQLAWAVELAADVIAEGSSPVLEDQAINAAAAERFCRDFVRMLEDTFG